MRKLDHGHCSGERISEQARAAIGAGGDKLQLPGLELATVDGYMSSSDGINAKRVSAVAESCNLARRQPATSATADGV